MSRQPQHEVPAWEIRDLTKRFPGVVANDCVNLTLHRAEIHGLMGGNGCGKSTLIKALMGVHRADSGEILRDGKPVTISDPTAARRAGIAAVFQEFSLIPTLTVAENIHLGALPGARLRVDWRRMRANAITVLGRLNVAIDPDAIVGDLSVADQQLVEIAKAIATDATMIILDEPTTALGRDEIGVLHRVLKALKAQGATILYVSHRLDEVVELVDCVTVLKDGAVVSAAEETPVTIEAIIGACVSAMTSAGARPRHCAINSGENAGPVESGCGAVILPPLTSPFASRSSSTATIPAGTSSRRSSPSDRPARAIT